MKVHVELNPRALENMLDDFDQDCMNTSRNSTRTVDDFVNNSLTTLCTGGAVATKKRRTCRCAKRACIRPLDNQRRQCGFEVPLFIPGQRGPRLPESGIEGYFVVAICYVRGHAP